MAPRLSRRAPWVRSPLYVAGAFGAATGLGASARLCFATLQRAGLNPIAIDLTGPLMQRPELPIPAGSPMGPGPGVVILHVNGPLVPLALLALGRRALRQKRIVGYWHWELDRLPDDWDAGLSSVHEIWVPSEFVREAIEKRTQLPVRILPHPVMPADAAAQRSDGTLQVLTLFDLASSFERKNPEAAIAAFRQAFGAGASARMILKVTNSTSYPAGMARLRAAIEGARNITITTDTLSEAELLALIGQSDILLSLHRAEGFGLPLAQAMAFGKAVVATGWSGNMEFMTSDSACLVPYGLIPAVDPQQTYNVPGAHWADPDIAAAAGYLRELADNKGVRDRIGQHAKAIVAARSSPERYMAELERILPQR